MERLRFVSLDRRLIPTTFLFGMSVVLLGMSLSVQAAAAVGQAPAVTLAPLDCMARGLTPPDAQNRLAVSLPFYQPSLDRSQVDSVVRNWQQNAIVPPENGLTLWSYWNDQPGAEGPLSPVAWNISDFTGFAPQGPLVQVQRGRQNSYGKSGVQFDGRRAGMWMSSQDPDFRLFNGAGSINVGCWYYSAPLPRLFASPDHQLDVSFDIGIGFDDSTPNEVAQAYFALIARNRQADCQAPRQCEFTLAVEVYTRDPKYATEERVHSDHTGTLQNLIAQTGLDSANWLTLMGDSIHHQTQPFDSNRVHFRISPAQFRRVLQSVATSVHNDPNLVPSLEPADYDLTLLNVIGEINVVSTAGHSRLGMNVSNLRVTSVIGHQAMGAPWGHVGEGSGVVFRNSDNSIQLFKGEIGQGAANKTVLSAGPALGDPVGHFAAAAPRVVYRDNNRAIREIFRYNGQWTEWNLSAALGAAQAYSDPRTFVDSEGLPHVVYRDMAGDIHEFYMDAGGWHRTNLSTESVPARPRPALGAMAYVANGAPRIVFRTVDNGIGELYYQNGQWRQWDMTALAGPGAFVQSDPQGFADIGGLPRIVYLDSAGHLHELRGGSGGWTHTDISQLTGAPKGMGNPMGFVAGNAARVVYRGEDGRILELVDWNGQWLLNDLSATRGALKANADPMGFVDAKGVARIVYRGYDDTRKVQDDENMLHELFYSGQWLHRDL